MGSRVVGAVRRRFRWDHQMDPRIAFLSPLPPAKTGIASYAQAVLGGLRRIGYSEHKIQPIWPIDSKHEGTIPWYTMGIYQLGNNVEFHRDIYRHAIQTPGLVVIHDLALDDFVRGLVALGDPLGNQALREALVNAPKLAGMPDVEASEPLRIPWAAHAARHARGVIVHSPFCERYLRALGCLTPIYVAPHPPPERPSAIDAAERRAPVLRGQLEAQGARSVVGVFGDLNAAKLIDVVLAAAARLGESVHVLLVGRRIPGYEVEDVVAASGLGGRVTLLTDVSDPDFLAWLCASDVVVDLRSPHRGEVSGSLARAMQAGRPTVVSQTGTYRDVPDGLVAYVSPGRPDSAELAGVVGSLLDDPERSGAMGAAARAHMDELRRSETTAHVYARAIDDTLELLRDPTRRALARWGRALTDIGVNEQALGEGYGIAYARALDELSPRGAPPAGEADSTPSS